MRRSWGTSLLRLLASGWAANVDYSADAAKIFARVDLLLRQRHFEPALDAVLHILHYPMAEWQRLHLLVALAHALGELRDYSRAISTAEDALTIADALHDHLALRELLFLRAEMSRDIAALGVAARDYQQCLDMLYDPDLALGAHTSTHSQASAQVSSLVVPGVVFHSDDPGLEMDVLLGLFMVHFQRCRFEHCGRLLDRADDLIAVLPLSREAHLQQDLILWMRALLGRWTLRPWAALADLEDAQHWHDEAAHGAGRILTVVADVALDCALDLRNWSDAPRTPQHGSFYIPWYDEDHLLRIAEQKANLALRRAREDEDDPGEVLALLALGRHSRYCRFNERRIAGIEASLFTARQLDDTPLLIQVLSALGSEFADREETGSALNQCAQAMTVAERAGIPAMALWAHKLHEDLRGSDGEAS